MSDNIHHLDKNLYRHSFDRAASRYDKAAVLQKEVGKRLLERLDYVRLTPQCVLDLGAGTGLCTGPLSRRYHNAQVIALDIAPAMLRQARTKQPWLERTFFGRQRFVCGDADYLPLKDDSVDLIFSNLTLQWCTDLDRTFAECRRVLKPNGLLMFTSLGPDTLKELRQSWQRVDSTVHVHTFIDMHDVGDALLRARLADPVMDMETITLTYQDVHTLMRDLKTLGAHNASPERTRSLTGKSRFLAMFAAYEQYRVNGLLPATYEVVYGQAWAPADKSRAEPTTASEVPVTLQPRRR